MPRRTNRGFTLIELLVFIAIFTLVVEGIITMLVAVSRVQGNQTSAVDVETQGQFLLQKIQYYIASARLVDMPEDTAEGTLTLREDTAAADPTTIYALGGVAYLTQGSGSPQALTSGSVSVSGLSFTRYFNIGTSSAYGSDSVSFSFTIAENTTNATREYHTLFKSSSAVSVPVGKIAMLQQAEGSGHSLTSVSFAGPNEAGDLLIAVVSVLNNPSASISLTDTAGNAWAEVANPAYPAYGEQIGIFAATDAKAGSNTVNLSFSTTTSNETRWLSVYEYRGAATSSSFDAWSTALQPDTATPSSGEAYPTSTAELALGVVYSNPFTTAPAAGSGYTVETTSTYAATSVEDGDIFVTGGVSAGWTYAQAVSSTATVVTFK